MFTQRAIRRLDPDRPITDEQLRTILDAGSKAPSGANMPSRPGSWSFATGRRIREFGALYHEAWWAKRRDEYGWSEQGGHPGGVALPDAGPAGGRDGERAGGHPGVLAAFGGVAAASTFPAVQNILLAARALGIGTVLTTLHPQVMDRVHAMFGVPAEMAFHCCIPLGYPRGRFGPTARYPTSRTTSWNDWGNPPPWA